MPYDYSAWPTVTDLKARLVNMGIDLPVQYDDAALQNALDSAVAFVAQQTKRNFLPVTETRYFDGSGTGVIEVDPFRVLTTLSVIGYLGSLTSYSYTNVHAVTNNFGPSTQVQIYQGSFSAFGPFLVNTFPEGRSNIAVLADWGYADGIPADLWDAVLSAAAQKLARRNTFSATGPLSGWKEGDISESFTSYTIEQLSQYPELDAAIARYSRPLGARLRNRTKRMV